MSCNDYIVIFYSSKVLDIATLTGACSVALGTAATGVFCIDSQDFAALERCLSHYHVISDV